MHRVDHESGSLTNNWRGQMCPKTDATHREHAEELSNVHEVNHTLPDESG